MKELIVIRMGDSHYGVWNENIPDLEDINRIHSLPWSSSWFSGVSTLDNRTLALFDLSVCTAHGSYDRKGQGRAIIIQSGEGTDVGFVFQQEAGRLEVAEQDILPMPEHLNSAEFSECVLKGDQLIPVIDLAALYRRVKVKGWNRVIFEFPEGSSKATEFTNEIRLFRLGESVFAISAEILARRHTSDTNITRLPVAPPHVEGITVEERESYALLNLAQFLQLENVEPAESLLLTNKGGLGFLVNAEEGLASDQVIPMPPAIHSNVIKQGIFHQSRVIPLIDLYGSLIASKPTVVDYLPESDFPALFKQGEVAVTEFRFLGMTHGIPESETCDVIEAKPYRKIPGQRSIILGVAEHEGSFLPVLDLAACFGRRTQSRKGDKMIFLNNGDFHALVVTEGVRDKLAVEKKNQHSVPVNQPHLYVYGCYISEDSIRLILNVEALTTYFDEIEATGIFSQFIQEFNEDALSLDGLQEYSQEDMKALTAAEEEEFIVENEAGASGPSDQAALTGEDTGTEYQTDQLDLPDSNEVGSPFLNGPLSLEKDEIGEVNDVQSNNYFEKDDSETVSDSELDGSGLDGSELDGSGQDGSGLDGSEQDSHAEDRDDLFVKETQMDDGKVVENSDTDFLGEYDEGGDSSDPIESGRSENGELEAADIEIPDLDHQNPAETDFESGGYAESDPIAEHPFEADGTESDSDSPHSVESSEEAETNQTEYLDIANEADKDSDSVLDPEREPAYGIDEIVSANEHDHDDPMEQYTAVSNEELEERAPDVEESEEVESNRQGEGIETDADDISAAGHSGLSVESGSHSEGGSVEIESEPQRRTHIFTARQTGDLSTDEDREYSSRSMAKVKNVQVNAGRTDSQERRPDRKLRYALLALLLGFLLYLVTFFYSDSPEDVPIQISESMNSIDNSIVDAENNKPGDETAGDESNVVEIPDDDVAIDETLVEEKLVEEVSLDDTLVEELPEEEVAIDELDIAESQDTEAAVKIDLADLETESYHLLSEDTPVVEESVENELLKETDTSDSPGLMSQLKKKTALLLDFSSEEGTVKISEVDAIPVPKGYNTYVVVKGDTLWHISKRFTGNPFNYPQIAENSDIKNPDLIFPGQTIFVKITN